MVYKGKVKDGVIVFPKTAKLVDGTTVDIHPRPKRRTRPKKHPSTFAEKLAPFIGMADDLPADMSKNHDHYLYGKPKHK